MSHDPWCISAVEHAVAKADRDREIARLRAELADTAANALVAIGWEQAEAAINRVRHELRAGYGGGPTMRDGSSPWVDGANEVKARILRAELAARQETSLYVDSLNRVIDEQAAVIARVRDLGERLSRAGYTEYGQDVLRALGRGTE